MVKQGLTSILTIILVVVLSSVTVANNQKVQNPTQGDHLFTGHSCHDASGASPSSHHSSDSEDSHHHNDHHCCHGHSPVASLVATGGDFHSFSLRQQHMTEYRFVSTAHCSYPDFRPPIV